MTVAATLALLAFGAGNAQAQAVVVDSVKRAGDDIVEDGKAVICFLNPNAALCKQEQEPTVRTRTNPPPAVNGGQARTVDGQGSGNSRRDEIRRVQSALNGVGFDAGTADGISGQRTRSAISDYQAHMGFPVTGELDAAQRAGLLAAYDQIASGAAAERFPQVASAEGEAGLLRALEDPTYAERFAPEPEEKLAGLGEPAPEGLEQDLIGDADKIAGLSENDVVQDAGLNGGTGLDGATGAVGGLALPDELALPEQGQAQSASMAEHCELVAGLTQINLGPLLSGTPANADQALGEQFCDARAYSITQSNGLLDQLGGNTGEYVNFCTGITERLAPAIALIPTGDTKQVAVKAQEIMEPIFNEQMSQASTAGRICLGLGYRLDDPTIALGATAMLLAAAELPYAELLGHHSRWGFGTTIAPQTSRTWYATALSAMERGAAPVFSPSKSVQRNAIIKGALDLDGGQLGSLSLPTLD